MPAADQPLKRKLVIVGDGACGKTSLLCVFAIGEFPREYQPTIFDNYVAEIRLDGKAVQLALWDTAGQEEYERLRPLSYSKSHVVLIAFAIDTPDSLDNVTVKWDEEVRRICGPSVPIILVGLKSDLRPSPSDPSYDRYIPREKGEEVAQQIGAREYKECSALLIQGVDDVFEAATRASLLARDRDNYERPKRKSEDGYGGIVHGSNEERGCCVVC